MTDTAGAPTKRIEFTVRALILGSVLGVIFTAANVYLGLKVGLTFASSIPAAVISMAILTHAEATPAERAAYTKQAGQLRRSEGGEEGEADPVETALSAVDVVASLVRQNATVQRSLDWVLSMRRANGTVLWACTADDRPWDYALLTGSSSIAHALHCGARLAELINEPRPDWVEAGDVLADVVATQPDAFEPKERWAMDWYYPVLTSCLTGEAAKARLADGWAVFAGGGSVPACAQCSHTADVGVATPTSPRRPAWRARRNRAARHRRSPRRRSRARRSPGRSGPPGGRVGSSSRSSG